MICNFCGKFKEQDEYKHKVILDYGDHQKVIFCCRECLEELEYLFAEKYLGRNRIHKEFVGCEKIK
jgi:hypothetical protein